MNYLREVEGGVRLAVHVQPRAGKTEISGTYGEALKIRIAAPPVDGAANRELTEFVARELDVPRWAVHLVSGARGRDKVLEVEGIGVEAARARLGGEGAC